MILKAALENPSLYPLKDLERIFSLREAGINRKRGASEKLIHDQAAPNGQRSGAVHYTMPV